MKSKDLFFTYSHVVAKEYFTSYHNYVSEKNNYTYDIFSVHFFIIFCSTSIISSVIIANHRSAHFVDELYFKLIVFI